MCWIILDHFPCLWRPPNKHHLAFCTQVGLRGGVYRVQEHARYGGESRRGRDRQTIRKAAKSTSQLTYFGTRELRRSRHPHHRPTSRGGSETFSLSDSHTRFHPWEHVSLPCRKPFFRGWLLPNTTCPWLGVKECTSNPLILCERDIPRLMSRAQGALVQTVGHGHFVRFLITQA